MAYVTPKTDWTSTDGVSHTDMNRIEGNTLQNHTDIGTVSTSLSSHTGTTGAATVHCTAAQARASSTDSIWVECRTSDPTTSLTDGRIWLRTDL